MIALAAVFALLGVGASVAWAVDNLEKRKSLAWPAAVGVANLLLFLLHLVNYVTKVMS